MEGPHCSGDDQTKDQIASLPKRRRRRAMKSSNLSERLNPDFDPKGGIAQKYLAPEINLEEKVDSKINFDSLNLTSQIRESHQKLLQNYLPKILLFLQSDQKEMYFPILLHSHEDFLVKIAQNNNVLKSVCDEGSLGIVNFILEAVEKNKNVFKWVHTYETGKMNKKVLVYKKLDVNQRQNCQDGVICTNSPTPSTVTSDLQKMSLNNGSQDLPPSIKTSILNTTLKFIKDPTQLSLEYPKMPLPQAQHLHNLILPGNRKDENVGYGFRSMYATLYDKIESLKEKYDFDMVFAKTEDPSTTRLILNKMPKMPQGGHRKKRSRNNSKDLNSSLSSTTSNESNHRSKADKLRKVVQMLPEDYLKNTLEKFLTFIEDQAMASLEYRNVNNMEFKFLERLISMSCSEESHKLFSPDVGALLKRVSRAGRRGESNLRLDVGKLSRSTGLRTVTFYKTPSFGGSRETTKPIDKQNPNHNNVKLVNLEVTVAKNEDRKVTLKNISPVDNKCREKDEEMIRSDDKECNSDSMEIGDRSQDHRPQSAGQKPAVSFVSAGSLPIDPQSADSPAEPRSASPPPASRKGRLLKALTKPIEIGRAERMMRMMGWEGGALGARGEGITEPILPALHISPGAGLGHVKQVNHSIAEYREKYLRDLHSFIKSSSAETSVRFGQPLTARECRFVKPSIDAFNDRRKIGLSEPEELELVKDIVEAMLNNPELRIGFLISEDKTEIHLTKQLGPAFEQKLSKKKKKSKSKQVTNSTNGDVITVTDTTKDIEHICPTRKSTKKLAYRLKYLEKIKELLNEEGESAEYVFDCVINKKDRNYIQNVITDVNKGVYTVKFSEMETDLVKEIRKIAKGCYMSVDFGEKKFTLRKKLPRTQATNSVQNLPPPKSKDLKNTIIYQNNVVIRVEEYDKHIKNITNDKNTIADNHDDLIAKHDCKINTNYDSDTKCDENSIYNDDTQFISDSAENTPKNLDGNVIHDKNMFIDDASVIRHENINSNNDIQLKIDVKEIISKCDTDISDVNHENDENIVSDGDMLINDLEKVVSKSSVANDHDNMSFNKNNANENAIDPLSDETVICVTNFTNDNNGIIRYSDNQTLGNHLYNISTENDDNTKISESKTITKVENGLTNIYNKYRDICNDEYSSNDDDSQLTSNDKTFSQSEGTNDKEDMAYDSSSDFTNGSPNLDVIETEITNFNTKLNISDTEYDKINDLHAEVNNNNDIKDRNNTVLSEEIYTAENIKNKHTNKRFSLDKSDQPMPKRSKFLKYVSVISEDEENISLRSVKLVQKIICDAIDENKFLPLLKCHGIKDGGLVYSCHSEDSYDWLKSVLSVAISVKIIDADFCENAFNLTLKINSFIQEDVSKVLHRLTLYNPELDTKKWEVLNEYIGEKYIIYNVKVDEYSFKYISENGFSLFSGGDKVQFSILWD